VKVSWTKSTSYPRYCSWRAESAKPEIDVTPSEWHRFTSNCNTICLGTTSTLAFLFSPKIGNEVEILHDPWTIPDFGYLNFKSLNLRNSFTYSIQSFTRPTTISYQHPPKVSLQKSVSYPRYCVCRFRCQNCSTHRSTACIQGIRLKFLLNLPGVSSINWRLKFHQNRTRTPGTVVADFDGVIFSYHWNTAHVRLRQL
jgi:hypothetical protein